MSKDLKFLEIFDITTTPHCTATHEIIVTECATLIANAQVLASPPALSCPSLVSLPCLVVPFFPGFPGGGALYAPWCPLHARALQGRSALPVMKAPV